MKIAVLGTRGIPNHYGGFEQFAEFFSVYLAQKGHDVYVYNSHSHPYKEKVFNGVNIIHKYDPEHLIGSAGQYIYDLNCILDSRKRNFDIILQLGYTSSSVWYRLMPKTCIVTNMDGMEWKRSKYSALTRKILKISEKLAVKSSDYLVADSVGIQKYIKEAYARKSAYIAYGAEIFTTPDESILQKYGFEKYSYNMLIARFEPENNLQMILDGAAQSTEKKPFLVIGRHNTPYGEYLKKRYIQHSNIHFLGAVYNLEDLNNLRYFSSLYFHGHSVGGTNPSLLEAMASGALIAANNNEFNKGVLKENAFYFSTPAQVAQIINTVIKSDNLHLVENNSKAIEKDFSWDIINGKYLKLFEQCLAGSAEGM